jgi:hypothetical protein
MKVGKNASGTCAVLFRAYGGGGMKNSSVFAGINGLKRAARAWKVKEIVVQSLTEPMKMLKKCRVWCIQRDVQVSELWLCN